MNTFLFLKATEETLRWLFKPEMNVCAQEENPNIWRLFFFSYSAYLIDSYSEIVRQY